MILRMAFTTTAAIFVHNFPIADSYCCSFLQRFASGLIVSTWVEPEHISSNTELYSYRRKYVQSSRNLNKERSKGHKLSVIF